ncbi:hypothetical protein [Metabacillus lacus]|uniref:hypothetical protein n=1 Tax=Metabacillus lacus TaxID=1983721 RepID=UPI0031B5BFF7
MKFSENTLLIKKCDMPTEMNLHYNAEHNSLKGKYRYDLVYSIDEEVLPDNIFDLWFEEVRRN